jgi:hypothetical protein
MKDNPFFKHKSILIVLFLSVLALGFADYGTGYEFSFFGFYFIPIAIAAWKISPTSSYLISILSSMAWLVCDYYSSRSYSSLIFRYWNLTMRFASFLIIAYTISKIRFFLSKEREISNERLGQIKTLSGLLPICASCKKIRDDTGYWERVEEYLSKYTDLEFTHGLCQDCVDKLLKEAGIDNPTQLFRDIGKPKPAKLDFCWIRRKMLQISALYATLPRIWKSTT